MNDIFDSKEYKRSRNAYTAQCAADYFVTLLVTDAFLAKLLSHTGISDALTGIISSFITMAFMIQIFSLMIVRIKTSTKSLVITFETISAFFYMLLYFTPFIPVAKSIRTFLIVACVLIAYSSKFLVNTLLFKWANTYVAPDKRARFSANKEIISLLSGMIVTLAAGYIVSSFENKNNIEAGFLFLGISILILGISNFIFMCMIKKESPSEHIADREPIIDSIKNILGNKNFRNVIILTTLWNIAFYFTNGFIGIYKTKDLMMSVVFIQIINIIANGARAVVTAPIGKYSDKFSFARGYELGLLIAGVAFICLIFTGKTTWWMIIPYTICIGCAQAGTSANSFNITYSYIETKYVAFAMAVKNSIGGIFGFLSSVAGGKVLSIVQANGNCVLGINANGQQVLGVISLIILTVTFIFSRAIVAKQKVMIQ